MTRRHGYSLVGLMVHKGSDPRPGTVVRQTDFDVTIGQCVVTDSNLAYVTLIEHKTVRRWKQSVSGPIAITVYALSLCCTTRHKTLSDRQSLSAPIATTVYALSQCCTTRHKTLSDCKSLSTPIATTVYALSHCCTTRHKTLSDRQSMSAPIATTVCALSH